MKSKRKGQVDLTRVDLRLAELSRAREMQELLAKVATLLHYESDHRGSDGPFGLCGSKICAAVRQILEDNRP